MDWTVGELASTLAFVLASTLAFVLVHTFANPRLFFFFFFFLLSLKRSLTLVVSLCLVRLILQARQLQVRVDDPTHLFPLHVRSFSPLHDGVVRSDRRIHEPVLVFFCRRARSCHARQWFVVGRWFGLLAHALFHRKWRSRFVRQDRP